MTNETKTPTPGPYYVAKTGNHQRLIISETTGANIAVVYEARDAALLAAAPELLRLAKDALAFMEEIVRDYSIADTRTENALRAIISTAEGKPATP